MSFGNLFGRVTLFSFLSLALLTFSARASNLTLSIPNISGDGTNGVINVYSFTFGVTHAPPGIGGGATRPSFSDISIMKALDSASSQLTFDCALGQALDNVVLTYRDDF